MVLNKQIQSKIQNIVSYQDRLYSSHKKSYLSESLGPYIRMSTKILISATSIKPLSQLLLKEQSKASNFELYFKVLAYFIQTEINFNHSSSILLFLIMDLVIILNQSFCFKIVLIYSIFY